MKNFRKIKNLYITIAIILVLGFIFIPYTQAIAEEVSNLKLIVDGKDITNLSEPVIVNNRTLVPIRFVFEEIGGEVDWDPDERSVTATRNNKGVYLKIGSYLIEYSNGDFYNLSDVEPRIINTGNDYRTYVPLRVISNAIGVGIEWDEETRTVYIDSNKTSQVEDFFEVEFISHKNGDTITQSEEISIEIPENLKNSENEIRLMLLEKGTGKGFIVGKEKADIDTINYVPKMSEQGDKLLVAAVYNEKDEFLGGDLIEINININPKISIKGISEGQTFSGSVRVENNTNFFPTYVEYEFVDVESGNIITSEVQDPLGSYTWTPTFERNGTYEVTAVAYDENDNSYESNPVTINISLDRILKLSGVTDGMRIDRPVSLLANINFYVNETHYIIRDSDGSNEKILKTIPYGSYTWFPGPDEAGGKQLKVRVEDTRGNFHESPWVEVEVVGNPNIILQNIGPNEVVTEEKELKYNSNVDFENVKYILTDKESGSRRIIYENTQEDGSTIYKPLGTDEGKMYIKAEGTYNGEVISTDTVEFNVYLGEIHYSKPIVEKDEFLEFASNLSVKSQEETGMSAALQAAQAILETGWGQSIPVDKYTGKFSYNLFGIKGEGTNGSIISNTWEVYNGVSYRVDDYFRAYNNENEAWQDHKNILLNLERYKGFRSVMYDSTKGAWAVRRDGYATDPNYAIKLMNIIDSNNLKELDEVEI